MNTNVRRQPPTQQEVDQARAEVAGLETVKRLLNSGPGGIAQLRQVTHQKLKHAQDRLMFLETWAEP